MERLCINPNFSPFFPADRCRSFAELAVLFGFELDTFKERSLVIHKVLKAPQQPPLDVYLKVYAYKKSFWQRMLRKGRVKREVRHLKFFETCGISVPSIVGWGQKYRAGFLKIEYECLITTTVPHALSLSEFAKKTRSNLSQRRRILRQLAQSVQAIHQRHFFHRDLHWRNLLVSRNINNYPSIYWIDCPSGYWDWSGLRRRRGRIKDLATLDKVARSCCSLKERLLFLKYYGVSPGGRAIRSLAQAVARYHQSRHEDDDSGGRCLSIKALPLSELEKMTAGAQILEFRDSEVKVLLSREGKIYKFFRPKRFWSSSLWAPYALRFVRHTVLLRSRGITAPVVESIFDVPALKCHVVTYLKLEGQSLRQRLQEEPLIAKRQDILQRLAIFIAELHDKGIFFRALHLGNILITPTGNYALIDVVDLKVFRSPLNARQRLHNFRHLYRYGEDKALIDEYPRSEFLKAYTVAASWKGRLSRQIFLRRIFSQVFRDGS